MIDPMTILANSPELAPIITALIIGIAQAVAYLRKRSIPSTEYRPAKDHHDPRLDYLVEAMETLLDEKKTRSRLTAADRKLRDRCIRFLAAERYEIAQIARAVGSTERVARRIIAQEAES